MRYLNDIIFNLIITSSQYLCRRFQEVPALRTARSGSKSGLTVIFNRDLFFEDNKTKITNFENSIKLLVRYRIDLSRLYLW